MRPLTAGIGREDGRPVLFTKPVSEADLIDVVAPGQPVAQFYGIGDKWIEFNLTHIAGGGWVWVTECACVVYMHLSQSHLHNPPQPTNPQNQNRTKTADSPALAVKSGPAWRHYSIGPPYIGAKADMAAIAGHWHAFVPRVYEEHPHLLAEMYAYCVAAAHLELPHLRLDHYMTSETESYGEAWAFVDELGDAELCDAGLSERTARLPVRARLHGRGCWMWVCTSVYGLSSRPTHPN